MASTSMTIQEAMKAAMQRHQAGQLREAEGLYRQILAQQPDEPDALHLLGVAAYQWGRLEEARELISRAIAVHEPAADYHAHLGHVLLAMGRADEAVDAYRRALALRGDDPEGQVNLGNALKQNGQVEEAIGYYRQALSRRPGFARAYNQLGAGLQELGRGEEALKAYHQAIALRPDYAEAYNNLGGALLSARRLEEAVECYRQALRAREDFPEAWSNLGEALRGQRQLDEAIACCRKALQKRVGFAGAYCNLGNALRDKGQVQEAIAEYRHGLSLRPESPEIHSNLANALCDRGRLAEALAQVDEALALRENYAEAWSNRANILRELGRTAEAKAAAERALELSPALAEAQHNLSSILLDMGQIEAAMEASGRALALQPEMAEAHNGLGNAMKESGHVAEAVERFERAVALRPGNEGFHGNKVYVLQFHPDYDSAALLVEQRRWSQVHADPLKKFIRPHDNACDPERCLRVGYVSAHFYDHAEAFFVVPLLENHDRGQVEIHGYASVAHPDAITERIRRSAGAWHDVRGWSDAEVAEQIRRDRIDILVDLTMHMSDNRALLFARKPAPVQVAWLAYPGGTGMEAMDYRLTDAFIDPAENDKAYVEESLRLPDCWCCYDPLSDQAAVGPRGQRPICFASLNNPCKLNEPLLRLWGEVMRRVVDSRLLIQAISGTHRREIARLYQGLGIASDRLEFVGRCGRGEYLRLYDRIDICLDPLPYNGITTTCDALWMGVPVVSLRGRTAAGRVGGSILSNIGLAELVGDVAEDFVRIAVELANDVPRLNLLRATLRDRMSRSPLMDGKRFAAGVESAYRRMWRQWCAKQAGGG